MSHDFVSQSASSIPGRRGLHVAIIMDGNGRWAEQRGLPRTSGHPAGMEALRRVVNGAPALGIDVLTVYAFSADNWNRPRREVGHLMTLFRRALREEFLKCVANGVRVEAIGRLDRLPRSLREGVEALERATSGGDRIHLRVALDYSARDAILAAARRWAAAPAAPASPGPSREEFARLLAARDGADQGRPAPDVDLLIRTAGEQRLSDFLLWECAYAEFHFTTCLWPDFGPDQLALALQDFQSRNRRFGGLQPAARRAQGASPW